MLQRETSGDTGTKQQDAHQVPGQSRDNEPFRRTSTREPPSPRMSKGQQEGQDGETPGPEGPRGRCPRPVPGEPAVHPGPGWGVLPVISGRLSLKLARAGPGREQVPAEAATSCAGTSAHVPAHARCRRWGAAVFGVKRLVIADGCKASWGGVTVETGRQFRLNKLGQTSWTDPSRTRFCCGSGAWSRSGPALTWGPTGVTPPFRINKQGRVTHAHAGAAGGPVPPRSQQAGG